MFFAGFKPHMLWMARSEWSDEPKNMTYYLRYDDWKSGDPSGVIVSVVVNLQLIAYLCPDL